MDKNTNSNTVREFRVEGRNEKDIPVKFVINTNGVVTYSNANFPPIGQKAGKVLKRTSSLGYDTTIDWEEFYTDVDNRDATAYLNDTYAIHWGGNFITKIMSFEESISSVLNRTFKRVNSAGKKEPRSMEEIEVLRYYHGFEDLCRDLAKGDELSERGIIDQPTKIVYQKLASLPIGELIKKYDDAEKVYKHQSYLVKLDLGGPVEIRVDMYHEDATELTRKEILDETLGYLQDTGIKIEGKLFDRDLLEKYLDEIETLEKN